MKKWGIWGLGSVGKSAIQHLKTGEYILSAYDTRELSAQELLFLKHNNVYLYAREGLHIFLTENEYIVPSPGIDTSQAINHQHKLVSELDLFCDNWKKDIIGITGSLGKTTLVTIMDQLLKSNNFACITGGNIGTPLLDLLPKQDEVDYALLELSSFQLEKAQHCKPKLAVLTNIYPNHLDRHGTLESYREAKYQLFKYQAGDQKALVPLSLLAEFRKRTSRPLLFFSEQLPSQEEIQQLREDDVVYCFNDANEFVKINFTEGVHYHTYTLAKNTIEHLMPFLPETRVIVLAMADQLGLTIESAGLLPTPPVIPEHRIELLGTYNNRVFYNDSKATIIDATIAAVTTIKQPVHLILGGLSKGVNRLTELEQLKNNVSSVICFGTEAEKLHVACRTLGIPTTKHKLLDDALQAAVELSSPGEAILLSPGGSSYDLYRNYKERGEHFKKLFRDLSIKEKSKEKESP